MVPLGWLSFRVVDCSWHCGPFSSLGHQVLLDERSLLQPIVAGLHAQPWVEDPTPATYSSSLWVSSTSPGMDVVGWALRSICRSCVRSAVEFFLRGTCSTTQWNRAWSGNALQGDCLVALCFVLWEQCNDRRQKAICLHWEVEGTHKPPGELGGELPPGPQEDVAEAQHALAGNHAGISASHHSRWNMIPPCPCPSHCSRLGDEKLLPWYATEAGAVHYKETTLSACPKASSSNPVAQ